MHTDIFDYHLPVERIAQQPVTPRDTAKLMVIRRDNPDIEHRLFRDLGDYLAPGDVLVLNETRVIPARLHGERLDTGGRVEVLLLHKVDGNRWECLCRPARKARCGIILNFGPAGVLQGTVVDELPGGRRQISFRTEGDFLGVVQRLGETPLPPYIQKAPAGAGEAYQTVYARREGSAAAPTAGLHFTGRLLEDLAAKDVQVAFVLLHVGLGTFRPLQVEKVEDHKMHAEYYELDGEAAARINRARADGGRVVAVGTTVARTLETSAAGDGTLEGGKGWTDIFIYPGYRFRAVDILITNFHFPRSSLLMLVSAFAGRERILSAYDLAIKKDYRFYSFGDAMLLL